MEGEKEGKTEGAGKGVGGVASLPGTSTQLLTKDDGSKKSKTRPEDKEKSGKNNKGG